MDKKEQFLKIGEELKPQLFHTKVISETKKDAVLGQSQKEIFDFRNHYTGYVSFRVSAIGEHYDSPCLFRVRFLENKREIDESSENYQGWISKAWIQEEIIRVFEFPQIITLPHRYAFRYVEITNVACSEKYKVVIHDFQVDSISSADSDTKLQMIDGNEEEIKVDRIAIRTLHECMQEVFEDGPKRDQRLWAGDLRLEALANYCTYKNNSLVKRCLYLLAGCTNEEGWIPSNLFLHPNVIGDHQVLLDYSVLFVAMLRDYFAHTGDLFTTLDLLPIAEKQLSLCEGKLDGNGLIQEEDRLDWCFLDWNLELNKQAGMQGVYLYSLKALLDLYEALNMQRKISPVKKQWEYAKSSAEKNLFDEKRGLFFSGKQKQYSWLSQVWLVLGGVFDQPTNQRILLHAKEGTLKIVTPYARHAWIEALVQSGLRKEAYEEMMDYWGKMAQEGCDTFYELYNPENPTESPYGSFVVNSYCHAWSCTPSYWLREIGLKKETF